MAAYLLLTVYPVLRTIYNSLLEIRPREPSVFVGVQNYVQLATDKTFWLSVKHTVIWATLAPVLEVGHRPLPGARPVRAVPMARFFRVAWFAPVLISYVVVSIMWLALQLRLGDRQHRLALPSASGTGRKPGWANPGLPCAALILVDVWKWTAFHMVVCLAALQGLPRDVLEAAEIDMCGWCRENSDSSSSHDRAHAVRVLVLGFIGKMKVFDLVWLMTQGGPLWSTETVSTYVYKRAFDWNTFDLGYPSAIATVWFAVILAC